jgi:hypothetical protein
MGPNRPTVDKVRVRSTTFRTVVVAATVVAMSAVACSGGYPDDLDEQLASFSDSQERRQAVLEANGIAAPFQGGRGSASGLSGGDSTDGLGDGAVDGMERDGAGIGTEDLTDQQRALRDGSLVATALPAALDMGEDWWTSSFDPSSEVDDTIMSYDTFRSCRVLVDLTNESDHAALAGAWYGDQRQTSNVQIWNRLFDTPTAAATWFVTESSATAMTCVRNLYLVTYEIDEAQIEGLVYDDVVLTRAEVGVAVPDDVEIAVFRADTPGRIDGEIHLVDSVAEVRVLIDRMVIAMRVLTTDAVQTSVLVDSVVPIAIEAARTALAGGAAI